MEVTQQQMEHADPQASAPLDIATRNVLVCYFMVMLFIAAVVVVNACAVYNASLDKSFGALAIAIVIGPMLNGGLALAGLLAIPVFMFMKIKLPLGIHLPIVLGLPVAAIVIDAMIIFSMDLHGC